jgi:hypothetical protein
MRGMKVTVDAAMRARDVSRPRADQEESVQAGGPEPGRPREDPAPPEGAPGPAAAEPTGPADGAPKGRRAHRRRRRR